MQPKRLALGLMAVASVFALLACTAVAPEVPSPVQAAPAAMDSAHWRSTYAKLAEQGGRVVTLDPHASAVRIHVFRSGAAARLGHNHVLSAPQFAGLLYLPAEEIAKARFDMEFRLDQLEIDRPEYRSALGSAFSSVLSPDQIQGTREHMLGINSMQADRYPLVRIHSLQITGELPKIAAQVRVEIHGQTRDTWVPLMVEALPDHLSVSGALVIKQTDYGIQPYSILGGLLAVKDEIFVDFKLVGPTL